MSVGYLEWSGVLFICVWSASACSPRRELCCLNGETGHRACTKIHSGIVGLRKSHWHIQESWPNAEKLFPLKSCRLLLRLKCIFSHVVGVFHVVYCDDTKKKVQFWLCQERHVFIATQIRLHSCYWVSQSLYSWLSILSLVIWPKHKKAQWMHQLYILIKCGGFATKHKLYDQIGAKSSNYCKIDIFSQSENVSVYL